MADQRRRGRRSGRGGRIPRRADNASPPQIAGETYVSFPLDQESPINAASALDESAVAGLVTRAFAAEPAAPADATPSPRLQLLAGLAGDLELALPDPTEVRPAGNAASALDAWQDILTAAYATGDRRLHTAARSVLPDLEREVRLTAQRRGGELSLSLFAGGEE